jgi:hypothetical protein
MTIGRSVGDGPKRDFTITHLDDLPERAEAVSLFQKFEHGLFPAMNLPGVIDDMTLADAQMYLDDHPFQEQWSILTITNADEVTDDDLAWLRHIPEINVLKIGTSKITDRGIHHIKWLTKLEWLVLCSNRVTDACLDDISQITSLLGVDAQRAPRITRPAYMLAMDKLPNVRERYPPDRTSPSASQTREHPPNL